MCEKCWRDASLLAAIKNVPVADEYIRLLEERKDNPCTPEEQAGEFNPRSA